MSLISRLTAPTLLLASATLLVSAWATRAQAEDVFVDRATGSGVTDSDLDTTTHLITTSVGEVSSHSVIDEEEKAGLVLRPTLMRLGESYVLGLSKLRGGKIIGSSQLKAANMDELDKVAERLTRSVLGGESAKANPRVGEITDHEAREGTQRRPTRSVNYVSFGGSVFSNLNSDGLGYSFGIGHGWDVNTAMIKIIVTGDFNQDAWMLSTGLGGNYFFSMRDIAPYVTGDFGAAAAKIDGGGLLSGQTIGGFSLGAGAGIQFLRTAAVNLDLGFRANFLLRENQLGIPQSYSLRLGIFF
jgi:hypothetical protein